ncbi:HEAT repeat domain-containing protein [Maioricimonas sp. JC845]|uniref:HEAT repeat domain-containing protein n=1 Tax=Maioricimonas sp. JC845 TaxID=3232138 RepID=UPI003459E08B
MTASSDDYPADDPQQTEAPLPEAAEHDLPPVEPPSAGFIVQLFVVPAIIVTVVIGVYLLFGRLASSEVDWRQLVTDVRSDNPHVKWRGALNLAQVLDADELRGETSQRLAANREIATALTDLYTETLNTSGRNEEQSRQLEFLSKALGRLDAHDVVLPVLQESLDESRERDVRKNAMIAIAMVAGRAAEQGRPLHEPALVDDLVALSHETDPIFRHQAAFTLGLLPGDDARQRLTELLDDSDEMTSLNAAIALARDGSTAGVPVFEEVFRNAVNESLDPATVATDDEANHHFETVLMLTNSFRAVDQLRDELSDEQRASLLSAIRPIAGNAGDATVRVDAKNLVLELEADGAPAAE